MKKALISGCTGQDGAYLSELLLSKGYEVHGASPRRSSDNTWRLQDMKVLGHENFSLLSMDVTCSVSVSGIIKTGQYDEVYNLAAQSFVKESFDSPISTTNINFMGVLNLLEAIRTLSPDTRFYQASTSEMFGLVNVEGQDEKTPFHPRSPYGVAKAAAHYAVCNYREAYGLHASCGILFNHESPYRGLEFVTRKVTDGVAQIVAGKKNRLMLGNMSARRDWGHAKDYVRGMWLMLQKDVPDDYVLATGHTESVEKMVEYCFLSMGMDYKDYVVIDPRFERPSDVPLLCGDATKATTTLAWTPVVALPELLSEMVSYDLKRHGVESFVGGNKNVECNG